MPVATTFAIAYVVGGISLLVLIVLATRRGPRSSDNPPRHGSDGVP